MCDQLSQFAVDKYLHLKGFLDTDNCRELTDELKKLVESKQTQKDDQCPKSEAVHGAITFDKLLVDLKPHFEKASGKKLHPTYSYARLYVPGEELVNHTDREACEISVTITLGFGGNVWPIYMGDDMAKTNAKKIDMEIGDAVLYYGMDKHHWREVYTEGEWQAQVFLHYVDADGPHKDLKNDKRYALNLPNEHAELIYRVFQDVLTPEACDSLVEQYTSEAAVKLPPIVGSGDGTIDKSIRNVERVMMATHKGLGGRLAAVGLSANFHNWKFDITHAPQAEFLIYPAGGRYQPHVDTFLSHGDECRKLTVLAFLNDEFKGGKFFIQDGPERHYPPQTKGTILVFPSFVLHGVEDIEEGQRCSAVCWMVGKFFK